MNLVNELSGEQENSSAPKVQVHSNCCLFPSRQRMTGHFDDIWANDV